MTTRALERLAAEVMGCAETTTEPVCDIPSGTYYVERYARGAIVWLRRKGSHTSDVYTPHADTAQAMALLEAWKRPGVAGRQAQIRLESGWRVELYDWRRGDSVVRRCAFGDKGGLSAIIADAVCEAMGIDPEATE